MDADVRALAYAPDGVLYAGGSFTTAGGVFANRLARWNGTAWQTVGTGVDGTVRALAFTPGGSLYIGGEFLRAGSVYSPYITFIEAPRMASAEGDQAEDGAFGLSVGPNPVSEGGTVRVTLAEAGRVRVAVVDVLGREVAVLADGERSAGEHAVALGAERLPAGVYVVRLTVGRETAVRRVTVVR